MPVIIRHGDKESKTKVDFQSNLSILIFSFEISCDCWMSDFTNMTITALPRVLAFP